MSLWPVWCPIVAGRWPRRGIAIPCRLACHPSVKPRNATVEMAENSKRHHPDRWQPSAQPVKPDAVNPRPQMASHAHERRGICASGTCARAAQKSSTAPRGTQQEQPPTAARPSRGSLRLRRGIGRHDRSWEARPGSGRSRVAGRGPATYGHVMPRPSGASRSNRCAARRVPA
jgi:hypothetical protein